MAYRQTMSINDAPQTRQCGAAFDSVGRTLRSANPFGSGCPSRTRILRKLEFLTTVARISTPSTHRTPLESSICQKSRSPSATARESTRRNSPRKTSDASAELFTRDPSLIPSRQRVQSVHHAARKNFLRYARCLSFPHCASEHRVPRQFCGNATRTAPHAPLALQLHIRHLTGQKLRA